MTILSYFQGPGTLTLGVAQEAAAQLTNCRLTPSEEVKSEDPIDVLSGEQLAGSESATIKWKLEGTAIQDLGAVSLTKYTFVNAGDVIPFNFVPSTAEGDEFDGFVRMVPIQIGGDAKKRNTADFSMQVVDADGQPAAPIPTWS